jgi:hypothetical protein
MTRGSARACGVRHPVLFLLLILPLFFSACEDWNRPVKETIEYYRTLVPVAGWEEFREMAVGAESGYTILVLEDMEASGGPVVIDGKHITVTGRGTKNISRASGFLESFFVVKNGGALTIGNDRGSLVLDGNKAAFPSPPYPASLITVDEGNLVLNGSALRNNICNNQGGGVRFNGGGFFIMNNSVISGSNAANNLAQGGGVYFNSTGSGSFTMNNSRIEGNGNKYAAGNTDDYIGSGGGVFFTGSGSFTMNNSVISGNTNEHSYAESYAHGSGGGVFFACSGTGSFIMNNSAITENSPGGRFDNNGGGVYFVNTGAASFIMNDSVINDNLCDAEKGNEGGGVYFRNTGSGSFIMNNSVINDNLCDGGDNGIIFTGGGGVFFSNTGSGVFTMINSRIEGNRCLNSDGSSGGGGGGVYFSSYGQDSSPTITMNNSVIRNNSGFANGGGIYLGTDSNDLVFTMADRSVISGNKATGKGGGVYIVNTPFKKERGAVIYGSNGGENSNGVLAPDPDGDPVTDGGAAVYVYLYDEVSPSEKKQETTAGAKDVVYVLYNQESGDYDFGEGWD